VEFEFFGGRLNEGAGFAEGVETVEPFFVLPGEVDGAFESFGPFEVLGGSVSLFRLRCGELFLSARFDCFAYRYTLDTMYLNISQ